MDLVWNAATVVYAIVVFALNPFSRKTKKGK